MVLLITRVSTKSCQTIKSSFWFHQKWIIIKYWLPSDGVSTSEVMISWQYNLDNISSLLDNYINHCDRIQWQTLCWPLRQIHLCSCYCFTYWSQCSWAFLYMDVLDAVWELAEKPRWKNSNQNKWYPDKYPGQALLLSHLETNGRRNRSEKKFKIQSENQSADST